MGVLSAAVRLAAGLGVVAGVGAAQSTGDSAEAPPASLIELLEETPGIRVETTSPGLGSVGIRIQGLPGEYTEVLVDGLPLLGVQSGGLGFAQVSALDIERVEVVKGPATALYGPSSLGGIVNLISRPPGGAPEVVLNQTSQDGTDLMAWLSQGLGDRWGLTVLGGAHRQGAQDVNNDAWADVPGFQRIELRPRLFWKTPRGASLVATLGGMSEERAGGTLPGMILADGQSFATSANTNRADVGLVGVFPVAGADTFTVRGSAAGAWERETFGPTTQRYVQHGEYHTAFTQATLTVPGSKVTWVVGAAYEQNAFHSPDLAGFEYTYNTPSLLAQATVALGSRFSVMANGRCDWQSEYGTTCSPRGTALFRGPGRWEVWLSGATGFFAPTPFLDETEGIPLARLVPFTTRVITICSAGLCSSDSGGVRTTAPFSIAAQRARYGSLDFARRVKGLELGATFFTASVDHPLILSELNPFDERPQLVNASGPLRTAGAELAVVYAPRTIRIAADYTYLHSTLISAATASRVEAPLTPRHSGALDVGWREASRRTRLGLHIAYTGRQAVFDDPYRTATPSYATVAFRASRRIGVIDLYLNGENLGNVRQTQYDPLLMHAPSAELQWTTEVWAPLEGRVLNAGVRVAF
ncbi:MAG TPA: TonB-dependent receptor [Gemmatimonadales bacterium]|nr:TonB-dependent receptor [Gemmatimonadales bacterium]